MCIDWQTKHPAVAMSCGQKLIEEMASLQTGIRGDESDQQRSTPCSISQGQLGDCAYLQCGLAPDKNEFTFGPGDRNIHTSPIL